jgi:hypothetical protein
MKYLVLLLLVSCAQMKQDWVDQNCNEESAYSSGVNDANSAKKSDLSTYSMCSQAERKSIRQAYLKGYKETQSNPMNLIKDAIGLNAYKCTLQPFTSEYSATNSRLARAKADVMKQCLRKNHEMHCDDPTCEKL